MNRTERKRQLLETLYVEYRLGKAALSDVLLPSVEMDVIINRFYARDRKLKRGGYKPPGK